MFPLRGPPVISKPPVDKDPIFPLFLLPTFNLPFRRQHHPENDYDSRAESPSEDAVPSLSSSPDSFDVIIPASPISRRPFLTKFPVFGNSGRDPAAQKRRLLPFLPAPRVARTQPGTIRCKTCATDLAFTSQIISRGFTGRHGRAILISPPPVQSLHPFAEPPLLKNADPADLINVKVGQPEKRQLVTGLHSVADIWCIVCKTGIGWKYVDAKPESQKYKIGKFILETARVAVHQTWEDAGPPGTEKDNHGKKTRQGTPVERSNQSSARSSCETNTDTTASHASVAGSSCLHDEDDDVVVFDSDDEDECDDIFAGVWDARTVAERRRKNIASMVRGC